MTEHEETRIYRVAFNAHELAERAMFEALRAELEKHPLEALMCLADPGWNWETRSGAISARIVEAADDLLDERLEEALDHVR